MDPARKTGGTFARRPDQGPRVAFVGPCGAGKSTVVYRLRELGVDARMPAQEHSGVADMWQKLLHPDFLVVLDAPNEVLRQRRPGIDLNDRVLAEERRRLAHAFAHAHLVLDTSRMNEAAVIQTVLDWLAVQSPLSPPPA